MPATHDLTVTMIENRIISLHKRNQPLPYIADYTANLLFN